ncbi:MAG: hypothetical protein WAV04_02865 [Candidatus Microsaccharimonas sp.]
MKKSLNSSLKKLVKHDAYLLREDVSERSITHKLAEHLQRMYPEWHVDCEFNRNLSGPKSITISPFDFLHRMASLLDLSKSFNKKSLNLDILAHEDITLDDVDYLRNQLLDPENLVYDEEFDLVSFVLRLRDGGELLKTIYPDIIVHKRGTTDNYIVIEAKKSTNHLKESRLYDLVKLLTLVEANEYKYKKGFFIDLPCGRDLALHNAFRFEPHLLNKKVYKVRSI